MFIEKDWLMKQEQINDQLRQRAEECAHRIDDEQSGRIHIRAFPVRNAVQRTLASAGRLLPAGGLLRTGGVLRTGGQR